MHHKFPLEEGNLRQNNEQGINMRVTGVFPYTRSCCLILFNVLLIKMNHLEIYVCLFKTRSKNRIIRTKNQTSSLYACCFIIMNVIGHKVLIANVLVTALITNIYAYLTTVHFKTD